MSGISRPEKLTPPSVRVKEGRGKNKEIFCISVTNGPNQIWRKYNTHYFQIGQSEKFSRLFPRHLFPIAAIQPIIKRNFRVDFTCRRRVFQFFFAAPHVPSI